MKTRKTISPPAFSLLAKPTGAVCNLACEYCFYLGKEQLYLGSSFRMSHAVMEAYIQQLLRSQQTPEVSVAWQGGEPTLMGLDFFRCSVELANRYKKPGQHVVHTIQTNGSILDDEWCAFFKEHNFLVGLSLDGPQELHDTYRVDKGGQGSFNQVKRAWDLLQKHTVDTNILCAVHAANAPYPLEVYRFFRDELQARYIQFIPIVERLAPRIRTAAEEEKREWPGGQRPLAEREGSQVTRRSVRSRQYGLFLIEVFEEWVHHDVGTMFVQIFDFALASWCHLPENVCVFQDTCGLSLVLEHNGDLYSCDHFVESDHRLGNILETPMTELVSSARQHRFGVDKRDRLPSCCLNCDVRLACHGECPRNRFLRVPGGGTRSAEADGLNYLCAGYRLFFHHVDRSMRTMANLLQLGHAPAEIMWM